RLRTPLLDIEAREDHRPQAVRARRRAARELVELQERIQALDRGEVQADGDVSPGQTFVVGVGHGGDEREREGRSRCQLSATSGHVLSERWTSGTREDRPARTLSYRGHLLTTGWRELPGTRRSPQGAERAADGEQGGAHDDAVLARIGGRLL